MYENVGVKYVRSLATTAPHHKETNQLICNANQLTGFFMVGTLVVNVLNVRLSSSVVCRDLFTVKIRTVVF